MKNLRHGVVLKEEVVDEQAGDEDDCLGLCQLHMGLNSGAKSILRQGACLYS